jgi:hypothetical protein
MDYTILPTQETVTKTIEALKERKIDAILVNTKAEALAKVIELVPKGASVNNGSSTTLQEIGLIDYLKGNEHGWNNLKAAVAAETDPGKQAAARNAALFSDYYFGSLHAMTQDGEIVVASASGSQMPHWVFTSPNLVLVVSTMKIMPDLETALKRLREYVVPLEDKRMQSTGAPGTVLSKILIFEREPAWSQRKITIIFVNEKLGF